MYRSAKEINNVATNIYVKPVKFVFMSISNQICVTKQIYQLHKNNTGTLDYLYFKSLVPLRMSDWLLNYSGPTESNESIVFYLNKLFIKSCFDLYTYKTTANISAALDTNVYRSEMTMGTCDDNDNVITVTKKYNDLLASDYGSIDVWALQTTEISTANARNKNMIPIYQKSMNVRNYDKSNQGYHATPEHASLNTNLNGYGTDMANLIAKKLALTKKNNTDYE